MFSLFIVLLFISYCSNEINVGTPYGLLVLLPPTILNKPTTNNKLVATRLLEIDNFG